MKEALWRVTSPKELSFYLYLSRKAMEKRGDGSRVSLLPNYDFGCLGIRARI